MVSFVALFQSTLPVWGATQRLLLTLPEELNFNPRSPCGERHLPTRPGLLYKYFNPRSPCGERQDQTSRKTPEKRFQSTLPVWGATGVVSAQSSTSSISIHAPRVGSDDRNYTSSIVTTNFNPRSPCGERRNFDAVRVLDRISIHAPRVGSDSLRDHPRRPTCPDFNPRSPCGERPRYSGRWSRASGISIHAPRVGSDSSVPRRDGWEQNFNPRSPCGERRNLLAAIRVFS